VKPVLAVILAALLAGCGGTSAAPSTTPSPRPTPELDAASLVTALESARQATFKIEYAVNGTVQKVAISGRWVTYQRPPLFRYDVFLAGGGEYAITTFIGPDGVVVCGIGPKLPCQRPDPATASKLLGSQALDANARNDPSFFAKAARVPDRIAGLPVTCFVLEPKIGVVTGTVASGEFCYTRDGLPLRLHARNDDGDIELNAMIVLRDFPPDDLVAPK
jgi:hypothetical protein